MIIGISILILGLPIMFLPASIYVEAGPSSVKASADVPEINAVFITTGTIIFLLGFTIYKKS